MLSRTVKRDVKVTRPLVVMLGRAVDRGRAVTRAEATPGTRKEGKEYASTRSSCEPCSITTRWKQTVLHPPPPPPVIARCYFPMRGNKRDSNNPAGVREPTATTPLPSTYLALRNRRTLDLDDEYDRIGPVFIFIPLENG